MKTNREFLNAVIEALVEGEIADYAKAELVKMDNANAKRKAKPSKKATENAPLVDKIVTEVLSATPMTASDVALAIEVTPQKASALCRTAATSGRIKVTDMKLKGRTVKGYFVEA